jgi:hypothetical protein
MTFMWDNPQPKNPDWWKPPSMFETSVYHKFRSPYTKIIPTRSDIRDQYLKLEPPSHDQIVAHSLTIHKILFSLLYGKVPELDLTGRLPEVTGFLADLVYYADYYAILDHVRPQIESWVKSLSDLWEDSGPMPDSGPDLAAFYSPRKSSSTPSNTWSDQAPGISSHQKTTTSPTTSTGSPMA